MKGLISALLITNLLTYSNLMACECDPLIPIASKQAAADLIFEAECLFVNTNWMSGGMKYTFKVKRYWKRRVDEMMVVNSGFTETDCGYAFQKGQSYLVYAFKEFTVKTDNCAGNKRIEEAAGDLELLGPSKLPAPSAMVSTIQWTIGILSFLALVFVAFVVLRKNRKS